MYNYDSKLSAKLLRDFRHLWPSLRFGVAIETAGVANHVRPRAIRRSDNEETWVPQELFAGVLLPSEICVKSYVQKDSS
jgi:hypothetical protein